MNLPLRSIRSYFVGLGAAFLLMLAPAQLSAQSKDLLRTSSSIMSVFKEVVAKSSQSTCVIFCEEKQTCLGTVVGAEGWILTKASELKEKPVCLLKDGTELDAKVFSIHDPLDLALLKVDAKNLKAVEWCHSKECPVGNWVASPGTGESPVAIGVMSVASRKLSSRRPRLTNQNAGYLGVSLDREAEGAKIAQVLNNTPAAKAGLKKDDTILTVDNKKIANADGLIRLLQKYKPGQTVTLKVVRDDKEMEFKAKLARRPRNRADFQNRLGSELSNRRGGFPVIIQHDSVIRARDCGGPLCDLEGRVIGINVARAGRTESYAIPTEAIRPILPQMLAGKFPPPSAATAAVEAARKALQQAEQVKNDLVKKLTSARQQLAKAKAQKDTAEKELKRVAALLKKLEAQMADAEKALNAAKEALRKAEAQQ